MKKIGFFIVGVIAGIIGIMMNINKLTPSEGGTIFEIPETAVIILFIALSIIIIVAAFKSRPIIVTAGVLVEVLYFFREKIFAGKVAIFFSSISGPASRVISIVLILIAGGLIVYSFLAPDSTPRKSRVASKE